MIVDVLAPSFLFPASVQHKEMVRECTERLRVEHKTLKLFYLIDTETREQQNHRMAVLVQDTSEDHGASFLGFSFLFLFLRSLAEFSLPFVEELASDNDLLRDRLGTSLDAFAGTYAALQAVKTELTQEKTRRKAAEAKVKELEKQLAQQKRGTV